VAGPPAHRGRSLALVVWVARFLLEARVPSLGGSRRPKNIGKADLGLELQGLSASGKAQNRSALQRTRFNALYRRAAPWRAKKSWAAKLTRPVAKGGAVLYERRTESPNAPASAGRERGPGIRSSAAFCVRGICRVTARSNTERGTARRVHSTDNHTRALTGPTRMSVRLQALGAHRPTAYPLSARNQAAGQLWFAQPLPSTPCRFPRGAGLRCSSFPGSGLSFIACGRALPRRRCRPPR